LIIISRFLGPSASCRRAVDGHISRSSISISIASASAPASAPASGGQAEISQQQAADFSDLQSVAASALEIADKIEDASPQGNS
jgi:hypothetical protein